MIDQELVDMYIENLNERYTAEELVELLGLSTMQIIDAFYEEVLDHRNLLDADRE